MADADAQLPAVLELPAGLAVVPGGRSVGGRAAAAPAFEPLALPRRVWADSEYELRYHVYSSPSDRVSVPANSAIEAIAKSGVARPFKVLRGRDPGDLDTVVISGGRLVARDDAP